MSENCLEEDAAGVEIDNENTAAVLWSVDAIPCPPRSRLSGAAPATTGSVCDDWKRIDFFIQRLDDNDCPDRPGGSRRSCRKSAFRRLAAASTKKNRIEKYPEVWSKPCGARQLGGFPPRRSYGFPNDCVSVRRLGHRVCSKKSLQNKLFNRSSDKHSESVNLQPEAEG